MAYLSDSVRTSAPEELVLSGMGLAAGQLFLAYVGELQLILTDNTDEFVLDVDDRRVNAWQLQLKVLGNAGADKFFVYGTPAHSLLTLLDGGAGPDFMEIRAGNSTRARLHGQVLGDGGPGADQARVYYAGTGTCDIFIRDSSVSPIAEDFLQVYGHDDTDDKILLRINNISNLHPELGTAEHVGVENLRDVHVFGLGGDDEFGVDSTEGPFTLWGGDGDDKFVIGQMFNSRRNAVAGLNSREAASIITARTTRGFLSRGNLDPMTIHGQRGDDKFYVQHNSDVLDLYGEEGNDFFSVRAFVLQDEPAIAAEFERNVTNLLGHHGDDYIQYDESAPVDIDGGSGYNTLVVIGTEFDDVFIIHESGIYGAGLFIQAINIQRLIVSTQEGNDRIYILSTAAHTAMGAVGDLGSDTFFIAPEQAEPVISRTFKGHSGIVDHDISSSLAPEYRDLVVEGIQAFVTDDEKFAGSLQSLAVSVDADTNILIFRSATNALLAPEPHGSYSYSLSLSRQPADTQAVIIEIRLPTTRNNNGDIVTLLKVQDLNYGTTSPIPSVDGSKAAVTFPHEAWDQPVTVTLLPNFQPLEPLDALKPGEQFVTITHAIKSGGGYYDAVANTDLVKLGKINLRLLYANQPGIHVTAPDKKLEVMEGGFGTWYELLMFPCQGNNFTELAVIFDPSLIVVEPSHIRFDAARGYCRQNVTVTAFNDELTQGTHLAQIQHKIMDSDVLFFVEQKWDITLLGVVVYDDDTPNVIVRKQRDAILMERAQIYYSQAKQSTVPFVQYSLQLTKAPTAPVRIVASSLSTQYCADASLACKQRELEICSDTPSTTTSVSTPRNSACGELKKTQAGRVPIYGSARFYWGCYFCPSDWIIIIGYRDIVDENWESSLSQTLTFNPTDWSSPRTLYVRAAFDVIAEGDNVVTFPRQPPLAYHIQGPLVLNGYQNPDVPTEIPTPLMYPWEVDTAFYADRPRNPSEEVLEPLQTDAMYISNAGGYDNVLFISADRIIGLGMGGDKLLGGELAMGGVTYGNMELVHITTGPGEDQVQVYDTAAGSTTVLHTLAGDDIVDVHRISGSLFIHLGDGNDLVNAMNTTERASVMQGVLAVDGGLGQQDRVMVINRQDGGTASDHVGYLTHREFGGFGWLPSPNYLQLINMQGVSNGQFQLAVNSALEGFTAVPMRVSFDATEAEIEKSLQEILFPQRSCGALGASKCSPSVGVFRSKDFLLIEFRGELAGRENFEPINFDTLASSSLTATEFEPQQANFSLLYGNCGLKCECGSVITSLIIIKERLAQVNPVGTWSMEMRQNTGEMLPTVTDSGAFLDVQGCDAAQHSTLRFWAGSPQIESAIYVDIRDLVNGSVYNHVRLNFDSVSVVPTCFFRVQVINPAVYGSMPRVVLHDGTRLQGYDQLLAFSLQPGDERIELIQRGGSACIVGINQFILELMSDTTPTPLSDHSLANVVDLFASGNCDGTPMSGFLADNFLARMEPTNRWHFQSTDPLNERSIICNRENSTLLLGFDDEYTGRLTLNVAGTGYQRLIFDFENRTYFGPTAVPGCTLEIFKHSTFRTSLFPLLSNSSRVIIDIGPDERSIVFEASGPCHLPILNVTAATIQSYRVDFGATLDCPLLDADLAVDDRALEIIRNMEPQGRWSWETEQVTDRSYGSTSIACGPLPTDDLHRNNSVWFEFFSVSNNGGKLRFNLSDWPYRQVIAGDWKYPVV